MDFSIFVISFALAVFIAVGTGSQVLDYFRQQKVQELVTTTAQKKADAEPQKSKPAWDLARVTLESYFGRNLSQISAIFWLSVIVMLAGFVVILIGISQAVQSPDIFAPAALATLAGIVTEFIGATFLFVYRSTIQQAINYSKMLERINSVGMAMQILDTMPDGVSKDDLKNVTKAALVELLVLRADQSARHSEHDKKTSEA